MDQANVGMCIPGFCTPLCSGLRQGAMVRAQEGKRKRDLDGSDICGLTKSFGCISKGILSKGRISKLPVCVCVSP